MLLQLPPEILLYVSGFLHSSRDLLVMARVNSFFRDLFLPCLYTFNVRHQESSAVIWAARNNKIVLANRVLNEYRGNANTTDYRLRTPIFHAIQVGSEEMIRTLLESAADIDWQDDQKQTPLLYALQRGRLSMARILLRHFHPSVDCTDFKDRNAIWYAVAHCDEDLVRLLLELQSDIWMMDCRRTTPLNLAISKRNLPITQMLLHHAEAYPSQPRLVDVNAGDHPLCLAVDAGLKEIAQSLIIYGTDLHVTDRYGQPLLHQAASNGHDDVIRLLLSHGVDVNSTDPGGHTALHFAAFYGHKSTTKLILNTPGIDIAACDGEGATALCAAARGDHRSVALQILAEEPANVNARCLGQKTALHFAVENRNVLLACLLIDLEALDPNICDDQGWTALSYAAGQGDLRMLELLLTRTDLDLNVSRASPIYLAAERGHLEVVRRLVSLDEVDINQTVWHKSPLFIAIENGYRDVAKLLLKQGSRLDVNAKTALGDTALHMAVSYRNLDIVELLLKDDRLDVTGTNRYGESALELAARNGKEHVVRRLCRDRRARNVCDLRSAMEATSNLRILYFLQGQLMRRGVQHDVHRSARLAGGSYQVMESRTAPPLRRSARLSQPRVRRFR
ncbi:putative ankyrin repeat protein [Penicillium rolfsii]|nr:putative ankyrin repeat protein [Penicillium rolfsii]